MRKKEMKNMKAPSLPDDMKGMEIVHHANFIEYLAKKNIKVVEQVNPKTKEKFLHLSKELPEELRKRIINNLLRNYADADSINRAIEDYQFESKPSRKK